MIVMIYIYLIIVKSYGVLLEQYVDYMYVQSRL